MKHFDIDSVDLKTIEAFASFEGAYMVWYSWKEEMLKTGREVAPERLKWLELPQVDKDLDRQIAIAVVGRFIDWLDKNSERLESHAEPIDGEEMWQEAQREIREDFDDLD